MQESAGAIHRAQKRLFREHSAIALRICAISSTMTWLCMPLSAAAADDTDNTSNALEEIVVTAQRTSAAAVQKTPIAISAFSAADLKNTLTTDIKDLSIQTPGLIVSQVAQSASIYIRGVGTNNVFNGSDPDVTLQIDGVYLARPNAAFSDFLDIDRIEVLRGPQGTLYGRNAVGGTINIISRTPSDTFVGREELTIGNFARVQEEAYISGPLIPGQLQGSLAISYLRHDAYEKNIVPGGNDIDNANRGGVRGQLRWEPASNVDATTRFDFYATDENSQSVSVLLAPVPNAPLANSVIGSNSKVALNSPQGGWTHDGGVSEEVNWQIDPHLSFKSISAYRKNAFHLNVDTDVTEIKFNEADQNEHEREITQEFDLQATYTSFDGVAGLYYFDETDRSLGIARVYPTPLVSSAPPGPVYAQLTPSTSSQAEAAFAQVSYHLTPRIDLTAGYRYTLERRQLDQDFVNYISFGPNHVNAPGFPFINSTTRHFHGSTPKFGINWSVADDAMLYFSFTRGYKSGGLNWTASTAATESFDPETITSYEVGAKTEWFDRRLRVNLTGFKYNYRNLQVQSLVNATSIAIGNAATASTKGAELEVSVRPTPNWQISSYLTLLKATYDSYPNAAVPATLVSYVASLPQFDATTGTFNASGNRLDAAPRVTASASLQRSWNLHQGSLIYARGEYYWQERTYYDPTNLLVQSQGPYGLINMYIGYKTGDGLWEAQLFGKNLADRSYIIAAAANGLGPSGLIGSPRTFGARVTRNF
jgi:iron complex outermembrane recepter protein